MQRAGKEGEAVCKDPPSNHPMTRVCSIPLVYCAEASLVALSVSSACGRAHVRACAHLFTRSRGMCRACACECALA
eukprot:6172495-Pleurochrysis_carterae.AAC.1